MRIAHELASWANSALGVAENATEMTVAAAKSLARSPGEKAAIGRAGEFLRAAREAAGITVDELGTAVDLSDPTLIEEAEEGKAALPFDLVLRLAGVLGRNDPISFALKLTRSYNPGIWKALDDLGVGKLVVQAGRERQPLSGERRRAPPNGRRLRACAEVRRLGLRHGGWLPCVAKGTPRETAGAVTSRMSSTCGGCHAPSRMAWSAQ